MGEWPNPNGGLSVEKTAGHPEGEAPDVPQCERGCATGKLRPQGWGEPQAENGLSSYYAFPIAIIWRGKAKRGGCAASRKDMAFGRAEDGKFVFHMAMEFLLDVMARCSLAGVARFSVEKVRPVCTAADSAAGRRFFRIEGGNEERPFCVPARFPQEEEERKTRRISFRLRRGPEAPPDGPLEPFRFGMP